MLTVPPARLAATTRRRRPGSPTLCCYRAGRPCWTGKRSPTPRRGSGPSRPRPWSRCTACAPRGQDADQVATALAGDVVPAHRPRTFTPSRPACRSAGVPGAVQSSRRTRRPLPLEHRPGRNPMSDLSSALNRAAGARRAPEPARRARVCCSGWSRRCTSGCGCSPYRKTPPCSTLGVEALEMLLHGGVDRSSNQSCGSLAR